MRWIRAHKGWTSVFVIAMVVPAFIVFSFGEPCACYTAADELAIYVGLYGIKEPTRRDVEEGFKRKFPVGKPYVGTNLLEFDEREYYSLDRNDQSCVCTYWTKISMVARKGYRVTIDINDAGIVTSVRAAWIESWFGKELTFGPA